MPHPHLLLLSRHQIQLLVCRVVHSSPYFSHLTCALSTICVRSPLVVLNSCLPRPGSEPRRPRWLFCIPGCSRVRCSGGCCCHKSVCRGALMLKPRNTLQFLGCDSIVSPSYFEQSPSYFEQSPSFDLCLSCPGRCPICCTGQQYQCDGRHRRSGCFYSCGTNSLILFFPGQSSHFPM